MARPEQIVADGDFGFTGVADRVHPAQLSPGILASGQNSTCEFGDVRQRWAVVQEAWGHADFMPGNPLACARWWEPDTGTEALIVITDGIRTDGGRGRAWQCSPGSVPLEIPMNGHDVWGPCRLTATPTALVLSRHGNARHYFKETAIGHAADTITLNCAPEMIDGERVFLGVVDLTQPHIPPLQGNTQYWVTVETGNKLKFYYDPACGGLVNIAAFSASGQWYVERNSMNPGPGGIGALPLILESSGDPGGTGNAFVNGFRSVPQTVDASITSGSALWSAQNHRFSAGQAVQVGVAVTGFTTTLLYYAEPLGPHQVYLHDTAVTALLGDINPLTGAIYSPDKRLAAGGTSTSNYLVPASYSGMPMVPLTETIYFKNRLIGLNARSNLAISDPGDLLHFTPFTGALTAALGNGDDLSALFSLGRDNLVLSTSTQLLAVVNLDQASTNWRLIELSREFGCIAPLSIAQSGSKVRFLSRSGVIVAQLDGNGDPEIQEIPMSSPVQRKFGEIDWSLARRACGAYFDNRYLLAVPLKGQDFGAEVNNCVFVWNFLTQQWDGWWTGAALTPVQFSRLKVGGEEVLCFLNASGHVLYFDPSGRADLTLTAPNGGESTAAAIEMAVRTRAYSCGSAHFKEWITAYLVVDTLDANWSLSSISEGVAVQRLYRSAQSGDHRKFFKHGVADFKPASDGARAALPYREDYSLKPGGGTERVPAGAVYGASQGGACPYHVTGLTPGEDGYFVHGNAVQLVSDFFQPGQVTLCVASGLFTVPASGIVTLVTTGALVGLAVTASITYPWGLDLGTAGLASDLHQTDNQPIRIPLHDRSRSLQFEFTNTQGSARLRSIAVEATLANRP